MTIEITLTKFQAEEIEGLLDVIADQNEIARCDEDRMIVWGMLDGPRSKRRLIVLDAKEAIVDLEYRAEWSIDEGGRNGCDVAGYPAAKSLLALAKKIEIASA